MNKKKKNEITIRSSAAEYLTFIASTGDDEKSIEMRYEDENIWLTQKMMATLYDVGLPTINEHIKKIYADNEQSEEATIRKFRIVQKEGERLNGFLTVWDREILQDNGKISAELAKMHAESEFEKYRIVQDRLYESDFDRFVLSEETE